MGGRSTVLPSGSAVKNPPAVQETPVQSLGQEDALEKDMQPTPVFSPGDFHGQKGLAGYSPWSRKESDRTEATECPGTEAQ